MKPTKVYDTFWRFAAKRQDIYVKRLQSTHGPLTDDSILKEYRFTNVYRASDRVSQYLIRNVIYSGIQTAEEIFFRTLLFKIFNKISTWEYLCRETGFPTWKSFDLVKYNGILDKISSAGLSLYSAAYIMPSPALGAKKKHTNHLKLLQLMMTDRIYEKIVSANSLQEVFEILRTYPSMGDFLAFQYAIDLNYSSIINFSEMDFVVAGPGARRGIRKCFTGIEGIPESEIIQKVTVNADYEFIKRGLHFMKIGNRSLQLIDIQNIFCEVDKYSRIFHPEFNDKNTRVRIKQKYSPAGRMPVPYFPPKWNIHAEEVLNYRYG